MSKPIHSVASQPRPELLRELRLLLTDIHATHHANSPEEGDAYICSTCDLAVKICAGDPAAICLLKVRENTQLDLLQNALKESTAGVYGMCAICGKRISSRQLKLNPLQELCGACRSRSHKKRWKVPEG